MFEETICEWMVVIDEFLSGAAIPISQRIFMAADIFMKNAIVEVKGYDKEEYLSSKWFKDILRPIREWYHQKYGAALEAGADDLHAVVELFGDYFLISIPLSIRHDNNDNTYWIEFPSEVQSQERPQEWIHRPPNFEVLDTDEQRRTAEAVCEVCSAVRNIRCSILNSEQPDDAARELARLVVAHLSSSAIAISNSRRSPLGLACWNAHQAVEKALKLIIRQEGNGYPHTHNLLDLARAAGGRVEESDYEILERFPTNKQIIEMRTGEGGVVAAGQAYGLYRNAVEILNLWASKLPRRYGVQSGRYLLRKLPWQIEE